MGEIIKGKPVADSITEELIEQVELLSVRGITPKLAIVRVGARGDDLAYEKGALTRCKKVGLQTQVVELAEDINQDDFIARLQELNKDASVNGILIFRPLPKQLDEKVIKYIISPDKDVDCFSPVNVGKMTEGDETGFPPCTPTAVMEILKFYDVEVRGKDVTVVGASMVLGKPVSILLLNAYATVTTCRSTTKDPGKKAREADIVVVGVGVPKFVKGDWVKEGAVVIDVGINVDDEGNMCGDADFDNIVDTASMITPVPGGVGSVTTSILAKHVIKACKQQHNIKL